VSGTASALRYRAGVLLRREGPTGLAKGILRHLRFKLWRVVRLADSYIYRYPIPEVDAKDNRPRVDNFEVRVVDSLGDIGALVARGYEDPRIRVAQVEKSLAAGAVAVCGYVDHRLAYVGWVAMSAAAKLSVDALPFHVDFESGEGVTGGAWTAPEYRGVGLYRYMFGRELALLRERGKTVCRNSIAVGNLASQRGQAGYGAQVCARGRLIRLLGWERWTETPMSGPCPSLSSKPAAKRKVPGASA